MAIVIGVASVGAVHAADEPGISLAPDEPGLTLRESAGGPAEDLAPFRLELAFGYASLLVDPDIKEGYGAGIDFAYGLHQRWGAELAIFVSNNAYEGNLGEAGSTFAAGSVTFGPLLQITRPGSKLTLTVEIGAGVYVILPALQETILTFGIAGGFTLSLRLARWIGVGLKLRYHLFNLATLSGPSLRDLKSLTEVGVIDRMEIPGYVAFYF